MEDIDIDEHFPDLLFLKLRINSFEITEDVKVLFRGKEIEEDVVLRANSKLLPY
jgi:hypothetical protein